MRPRRNILRDHKLIAVEDHSDETPSIDKIVEQGEPEEVSPLSTVAQIVAQRQSYIEAALKAEEDAKKEKDDSSSDDDEDSDDEDGDEDSDDDDTEDEDGDEDTDFDDPTEDEDEDDSDEDEDEDDSEDDDDDTEDDDDDTEDEDDTEEDLKELSFESFTPPTPIKSKLDVFAPIRDTLSKRAAVMESYGISLETEINQITGTLQDSSVAYTKDAIIEAISRLSELERKYAEGVKTFNAKILKSLPKLNERISNFERVFNQGSLQYSNSVISDVSLLKNISFQRVSSPRETLKRMNDYVKDMNDICALITNSPFGTIKDVFMSKKFLVKGDILEYSKQLPGFTTVSLSIPEFKNYMKTDVQKYQYYSSKDTNPNALYDLVPVSITQDKDVTYITENIKLMIIDLAVSNDILKVVEVNFNKFMDELKVLKVNVEEDQYEKLSELNLDEKVQSFILFKYIVEIVDVNINIGIDYVTTMITVLEDSMNFNRA